MIWRKPEGLKYTDLCIYIDAHAPEIAQAGENQEQENLIYNYIWLLVKALAIKKRMFENFSDYDGYAMYSATRLFFALRKSYLNEGKVIKGKTIKPIKSILNYTKALMYPMKLEYLHEQYNLNSCAEAASKEFNDFVCRQQMRENSWEQQGGAESLKFDTQMLFSNFSKILDEVLLKSPFKKDTIEYKKLRISILLNCLNNLNSGKGINAEPITAITWKLPKSMSNYVRLFIKELGTKLKLDIVDSYHGIVLDEHIIDYMIHNPDGEFRPANEE